MKYCSGCGTELVDDAVVCIKCGRSVAGSINKNDASSFGFAFLCFLIPIVGLILFLVWNNSNPKKSKSCGKGALIGFIVFVVIIPLFIFFINLGITNSNIKKAEIIIEQENVQNIKALERLEAINKQNDYYLTSLRTLANIMGDYDSIITEERRHIFDGILFSTISNEHSIVKIYSVWKPNALDGMDAQNIGRVGSSPTGQYAISYLRDTGQIIARASNEIVNIMSWIHGPNSRTDRIGKPTQIIMNGTATSVIEIMVSIISPRTGEVVGVVGCTFINKL